MERTFDNQTDNIQQVINDAKNVGVQEPLLTYLDEFLESYWGMTKVKPFTFQLVNGNPGVRWDFEDGSLSVVFEPDNQWSYKLHHVAVNDRYNPNCETTITFRGGPSFTIDRENEPNHPFYVLPDNVEKFVKLPDIVNEEQYQPMFKSHSVCVLWETNRYDGMISGYVWCKQHGICYAKMIAETEFERNRVFAIYKLSLFEKIAKTLAFKRWRLVMKNQLLYKWWWRLTQARTPKDWKKAVEKSIEKETKFKQQHEVVGYVVNLQGNT